MVSDRWVNHHFCAALHSLGKFELHAYHVV